MSNLTGQQLIQKAGKLHAAGKFGQAEKIYKKLLKANPNDLTLIRVLGMLERDRKNFKSALTWFELGQQLSGNSPVFLAEIGLIKLNQGKVDSAYQHAAEANQLAPEDLPLAVFFGKMCLAKGKASTGIRAIEHAITQDEVNLEAYDVLTTLIVSSGVLPVPLNRIQEYIRLCPNKPGPHTTLGNALRLNGQLEDSLNAFERALDIQKNAIDALAGKAEVLISIDKPKEAIALLKESSNTNSAMMGLANARAYEKLGDISKGVEALERLNLKSLSPYIRSNVNMYKGRLLDKLGQFDNAWDCFTEANQLHQNSFDIEKHLQQIEIITNTSAQPEKSSDSTQPIFIVGMYRSGTTLLEQILAAHPDIDAAGEVDQLLRFVNQKPYPECVLEPNENWSSEYLDRLNSSLKYCTDKMPMNYMHIGLIKTLFPNAKIIHTTRNPLDVCVSCYSNSFAATHAYTCNLKDFASVHSAYQKMMGHWSNCYEDILELRYEELVTDFENNVRKVIDFLALPFDENCLTFYKNESVAQTPSIDQVRQPIYASSIDRYKNYEKHLTDVIHLQ